MKRSKTFDHRRKRVTLGCERLEIRRVLDASALPVLDQMPDVAGLGLTDDAGFTATAQLDDWTYTTANGAVTITGYTGAGGAVQIPTQIDGLPVTSIGAFAFRSKKTVSSVAVPAAVSVIGEYAFWNCTGLTGISIPDGVTTIGRYAFQSCTYLTSVTIPSSVTNIGRGAFGFCERLAGIAVSANSQHFASVQGVLYNKSMTTLIQCPGGKSGAIVLPASVTSLANDDAIYPCPLLTSIGVEDGSQTYAAAAGLLYNKGLTTLIQCPGGKSGNVSILAGVTRIGDGAFWRCRDITNVLLPSGLVTIGDYSFFKCSKITSLTIPDSVITIGGNAFADCTMLAGINIPDSVTNVGDSAFSGCTSLTQVTVPGGVSIIGSNAFANCPNLSRIAMRVATGLSAEWGRLSPSFPYASRLVKQGAGLMSLSTASTRTGGTIVEAGELVVRHKDALGIGLLEVQAGAKATLQTGYEAVAVTSVSLATNSRLELGTSKLSVAANGFNEMDIRTKLVAGRTGGSWDGSTGITSTAAGVGSNRAIGYRVQDGVMEIAVAAPGDTNLDGKLDVFDLIAIQNSGKFSTGSAATWEQGDSNYDGVLDIFDLTALDSTGLFNQGSYATEKFVQGDTLEFGETPMLNSAFVFAALAHDSSQQTDGKRKVK